MTENTEFQVIRPPNTLKAKIPSTGGANLDDIMSSADDALKAVMEAYPELVKEEIAKISTALNSAIADDAVALANVKDAYDICHNIKGQAATMGFPLLTAIAQSFCRLFNADEAVAVKRLDVLQAHANAMAIVISQSIQDDGGAQGQDLVGSLREAVDLALAKT